MKTVATDVRHVAGPYFDDLHVGQAFTDAPGVTLTSGHAALHQAIAGDRLRLALDKHLSGAVTGTAGALAHPNLVCDVAIGQSTLATGRVTANLFYRGLTLRIAPQIGDTLHTTTTVRALKSNRSRRNGQATGLALLQVKSHDQNDREVLNFQRCAMLPARPGQDPTHDDDVHSAALNTAPSALDDAVSGWDLRPLRKFAGLHFKDLAPGLGFAVETGDVVSSAPELVRLSVNLAAVHSDSRSTENGSRLVYGGHTIAIAAAHLTRALPNLAYIVAWLGCDHTAPVFEGDTLSTTVIVDACNARAGSGGLITLRVLVVAHRTDQDVPVLEWRPVALMA